MCQPQFCDSLLARWHRAPKTNANSDIGNNCRMAVAGTIREFVGRAGGRARYIKEVDVNERTIRFAQEIYDAIGRLVAVHEKFPVDLGHKEL